MKECQVIGSNILGAVKVLLCLIQSRFAVTFVPFIFNRKIRHSSKGKLGQGLVWI